MKIILIDNYDSFTFNLFQLISGLGVEVEVYRNDHIDLGQIRFMLPDAIVLSPGPKDPASSGICPEVVRELGGEYPLLGVCLGMQVINEIYGGKTVKAPCPVHGKTEAIRHNDSPIFKGIPSPFKVARYHSLICKVLSDDLEIIARTDDNIPMALRHKTNMTVGVQFHPESFLSDYGSELLSNFLDEVKHWYTHE